MERRATCALLLAAVLTAFGLWPAGVEQVAAFGKSAQQAHACIYDHLTLRTSAHTCRPRARVYPATVTTSAERAVYDSALIFGVPYPILLSIARCESGLNAHASNGRRFGLFQFAPATFRRASAALRAQTGIVARSYWKALDSSYAAGFLFATGKSVSWTCETAKAFG
jgi:hypothetical protein